MNHTKAFWETFFVYLSQAPSVIPVNKKENFVDFWVRYFI